MVFVSCQYFILKKNKKSNDLNGYHSRNIVFGVMELNLNQSMGDINQKQLVLLG